MSMSRSSRGNTTRLYIEWFGFWVESRTCCYSYFVSSIQWIRNAEHRDNPLWTFCKTGIKLRTQLFNPLIQLFIALNYYRSKQIEILLLFRMPTAFLSINKTLWLTGVQTIIEKLVPIYYCPNVILRASFIIDRVQMKLCMNRFRIDTNTFLYKKKIKDNEGFFLFQRI